MHQACQASALHVTHIIPFLMLTCKCNCILIREASSSGRGVASGNWMPRHGYQVVWDRDETSVIALCAVRRLDRTDFSD